MKEILYELLTILEIMFIVVATGRKNTTVFGCSCVFCTHDREVTIAVRQRNPTYG